MYSTHCFSKANAKTEKILVEEKEERTPFDINLAVILAGFAFEAYASPPVIHSDTDLLLSFYVFAPLSLVWLSANQEL